MCESLCLSNGQSNSLQLFKYSTKLLNKCLRGFSFNNPSFPEKRYKFRKEGFL